MKKVYPSRVDWWLAAVLILTPVIVTLSFLEAYPRHGLLVGGAGVALAGFLAAVTVPCRYTLTEEAIVIRCGVWRQTIAWKDVRSVEMSGSWLSAPALSLRRVKIETMYSSQLVSPKDREGFVAEVRARISREQPDR